MKTTTDGREVVFFYGNTTPTNKKSKTKRVTVAGVLDNKTNSILIGVAQCSHKDRFEKSKGRPIALGRAISSNPYKVIKLPSEKPINSFIEEAKKIINNLV